MAKSVNVNELSMDKYGLTVKIITKWLIGRAMPYMDPEPEKLQKRANSTNSRF